MLIVYYSLSIVDCILFLDNCWPSDIQYTIEQFVLNNSISLHTVSYPRYVREGWNNITFLHSRYKEIIWDSGILVLVAKLSSSRQLKFQLNWDSIITTCLPPHPNRNSSNLQYHRSETLYTSISSKNMIIDVTGPTLMDPIFFGPKIFWTQKFFWTKYMF